MEIPPQNFALHFLKFNRANWMMLSYAAIWYVVWSRFFLWVTTQFSPPVFPDGGNHGQRD